MGDGTTDDSKAILEAIAAGCDNVPAGVYYCPGLVLPAGTVLKGDTDAWLRGGVVFGSNQHISGLKLGDASFSTRNGANISDTILEYCHLRGGGGADFATNAVLRLGDGNRSCGHIIFRICDIERNLGIENAAYALGFNNISITENGTPGGAHVESITLDGCHVGVSNGREDIPRNIGGPRAGLEAYTWHGGDNIADHGWSEVNILNTIFEATDSFCIDLADYPLPSGGRASGPARIAGCTIKGGGWGGGVFGYTVCLEAPKGVIIENNILYRGREHTFCGSVSGGYIVRNNTFDLAFDNGITPDAPSLYKSMVLLAGPDGVFTGNTVTTNCGGPVLELQGMLRGKVTGNTFRELRTSGTPWAVNVWDTHDSKVIENTFETAAPTDPVFHYQGTNSGNTMAPNTLIHGLVS